MTQQSVGLAAADFLQSEIQITRSDNNILRQDIQVFRERESQLTMRNSNLENKLIEQSDAILALKGVGSKRETPIGDELLTESRVGQMNLNVNFEDDESVDEREEKKVIEETRNATGKWMGEEKMEDIVKPEPEDGQRVDLKINQIPGITFLEGKLPRIMLDELNAHIDEHREKIIKEFCN